MSISYDGTLTGLVSSSDGWVFEGVGYDTPADEAHVIEAANEALGEPDASVTAAAHKLVFGSNVTFTSQAVLGIAAAYEAEVGPDGAGLDHVLEILREAARRIAVIEALTV